MGLIPPARGFSSLPQAPPLGRLFWKRSRATRSILWEAKALLRVSDRNGIRIDTAPGTDPAALEILNLGLALLLARRGHHLLHAAGLARRGRCAAILGPPGAGKSSLTLAGACRGMEVISDEIVPFRRRAKIFTCPGGNPLIRVDPSHPARWPEPAATALRQARRDQPGKSKLILDVRRFEWRCAEGMNQLHLLFLLGPRLTGRGPAFRLSRIPAAEALLGLLQSTFDRRVQSPPERRRHLRACAALARSVPAWRLSVRQGFEHLLAAAGEIDSMLSRTVTGPTHRLAPAQGHVVRRQRIERHPIDRDPGVGLDRDGGVAHADRQARRTPSST